MQRNRGTADAEGEALLATVPVAVPFPNVETLVPCVVVVELCAKKEFSWHTPINDERLPVAPTSVLTFFGKIPAI